LSRLRQAGIVPIMFYLQFENTPSHLVFQSELESDHEILLCRSTSTDPATGKETQRLLLDMRVQLTGRQGSGNPASLGFETGDFPRVPAGRMRGLQVLTRPVAPPGERQVTELPPNANLLQVHPFTEPYPVPEHLQTIPPGYTQMPATEWERSTSVWGLPNTDVNQHVNVHEYIYGGENQVSRLLHAAGLPIDRHLITKAALLFRKPFFPGQVYRMQGPLWTQGARTLVVTTFHLVSRDGSVEPRPSVAVRMEGIVGGEGSGA
ncbi:MAG TPA: hypothetical protein VL359_11640, partial [bacterium]|nr:hypothetical protein [bacterium]